MKQTAYILGLTVFLLACLDGVVALTLGAAERSQKLGSLVRYFEYGRSVPGKLERWAAQQPDQPGNLFAKAWRSDGVAASHAAFLNEPAQTGPVVRSYGMSFVNYILEQAIELRPELAWDPHAGPAAPPNYTYAYFEDDRANRRAGDVTVLGILSSSIPAMAALSNQTWSFEQPAPFTYPIYVPQEGSELKRIDPHITSSEQQRALSQNPDAAQRWTAQLRAYDHFFSATSYEAVWLDHSPFARLIRRSAATSHIAKAQSDIITTQSYPYAQVLQKMMTTFAQTARADGQIPIIFLIQGKDPADPDLLSLARPVLDAAQIPYLATAEHMDTRNAQNFLQDGHFRPRIDRQLAQEFLARLDAATLNARP